VINERFGLDLGEADQLLCDQLEETWAADETLAARARTNAFDNFRLDFDRTLIETVVKRMDQNAEIFKRILDEPEFHRTVLDYYATRPYDRLREEQDQQERAVRVLRTRQCPTDKPLSREVRTEWPRARLNVVSVAERSSLKGIWCQVLR
jgi:hypothetical protein